MQAEYIQRGEALDFPNAGTEVIKAGDILVLSGRAGVAAADIAPKTTGAVHVIGVFAVAKGGDAFAMGEDVFWDESAANAVKSGTVKLGYAACNAEASASTLAVRLG